MVAFTVYKSSKYLFDCVAPTDAAPLQPYPTVDINELEALRLDAVDVVKRMDYAELDKLIACCREHPPQTVVVPATHGDTAPFQKFAKYLKDRQRAGVVILADGRLLILAPLEKDDSRLRCVVVKAKSTTEVSAAKASNITTVRIDEAPAQTRVQPHAAIARPPPEPESESEQRPRGRVRSRKRSRAQQEPEADTLRDGERSQNNQSKDGAPISAPKGEQSVLYRLSRIERATTIAQLRHEYEAFNEHYYTVLREWSKSDRNF
ncbi:SPOC domain-containing protein [Phytophthora infestans]|uniref:SPOC domain-containing protein n=1 Tax=Phytophthora infestans TaxID=4787 RepID=A0A833W3Q9_PHYIN|nr:SPOC domain-containing protein [Phytophthora infestans]